MTNGHSLPVSRVGFESGFAHFRNPKVAGVASYSSSHGGWKRLGETWV